MRYLKIFTGETVGYGGRLKQLYGAPRTVELQINIMDNKSEGWSLGVELVGKRVKVSRQGDGRWVLVQGVRLGSSIISSGVVADEMKEGERELSNNG